MAIISVLRCYQPSSDTPVARCSIYGTSPSMSCYCLRELLTGIAAGAMVTTRLRFLGGRRGPISTYTNKDTISPHTSIIQTTKQLKYTMYKDEQKTSRIHTSWFPGLARKSGHLKVSLVVHTCIQVLLNHYRKLVPLLQQLLNKKTSHSSTTLLDHI